MVTSLLPMRFLRVRRWDPALWGMAAALSAISLVALASAAATLDPGLVNRQALWVGLGVGAAIVAAAIPYTWWIDGGVLLYVGTVLLLLLVEIAGTVKLGAARWLTVFGLSVQPSELAKLAAACCVAKVLAAQPRPLSWRGLMSSAGVVGLPALLIFLQPDLGTSSVLAAIWLSAVWVAGMTRRQAWSVMAGAAVLIPVGWHVLKAYQRTRLLVFLNPQIDPLGAGYTIIQSTIAVGSGQLWGRGWFAGTQNQLNFLPERHADFLFSVIAEEWGLLGAGLVVLLCAGLVWRAVTIAAGNPEPRGRILAIALIAWIAYQAVVNMGMVIGLLPVVGVPLPLVSYGGSAMVTTWVAIGILQSAQRFGTRF